MSDETKKVYAAIAAVSADLSAEGMGKEGVNKFQGYNFRGIDQVMDHLSPLLVKHGLLMLPRCTERARVEYLSKKGDPMFSVAVRVEFDFIAVEDGSCHVVTVYGEAMDSGDKATNKAMSCAYKYAAFQTFCIPVEVDDADASSPAPAYDPAPSQFIPPPPPAAALRPAEATLLAGEETFETSGVDADVGQPPAAAPAPSDCISEPQQKMLFARMYQGVAVGDTKQRAYLDASLLAKIKEGGVTQTNRIPKGWLNDILAWLPTINAAAVAPSKAPAQGGERACPQCGQPLALRKGPRGSFWSCTNWRKDDPNSCKFTENA